MVIQQLSELECITNLVNEIEDKQNSVFQTENQSEKIQRTSLNGMELSVETVTACNE